MFLLLSPIAFVLFVSTAVAGTAFVLSFTRRRYSWYVPFFALSGLFVGACGMVADLARRQPPFGLFWLLLVLGAVSLARWTYRMR